MEPIACQRFGFTGEIGDTPDQALTLLLQRLEQNGFVVVSVSVNRVPHGLERYEAYVVTRGPEAGDGRNAWGV